MWGKSTLDGTKLEHRHEHFSKLCLLCHLQMKRHFYSTCHVFPYVKDAFNRRGTQFCVDQWFCNGLNVLGFSCCLLFCVGGNPIGGLRKSQNKCFQMMMSCEKKKKKEENLEKVFDSLTLKEIRKKEKKRRTHAYILLAWGRLCRKTTLYSDYTLHLRTSLGFFVQNWREMTDFNEGQYLWRDFRQSIRESRLSWWGPQGLGRASSCCSQTDMELVHGCEHTQKFAGCCGDAQALWNELVFSNAVFGVTNCALIDRGWREAAACVQWIL